jgi:hypothetical protein
MRRQLRFPELLQSALVVGCTTGDPLSAPTIPATLQVAVEVDGSAAAAIDADRLRATTPDYVDEHRRAWRLATLLAGAYVPAAMELEVEQRDGTRTVFTRPTDAAAGQEPVLLLNRNGQVLIAMLDSHEPFPPFHGRGGNRGRAGDPDRLHDVVRVRLSTARAQPRP